jgi:hypothetical protein
MVGCASLNTIYSFYDVARLNVAGWVAWYVCMQHLTK